MPIIDEIRGALGTTLIGWALSVLPKREALEFATAIYSISCVWAKRVREEVRHADSRVD